MDRTKLIEAIMDEYHLRGIGGKQDLFEASLKSVSDANLVVYANEIGVDTDRLFTK